MPLFEFLWSLRTPIFLPEQMYYFFHKSIDQVFALVYNDNILLLAYTKSLMLELIEQSHQIGSSNLKVAPEKSFYILLTVTFLRQEIANNTNKPISSKVDGKHKLKTPTS